MTLLKTWNPCAILQGDGIGYNYAILILDRPISVPFTKSRILNLWENATVRVTVDGGTNRWLFWLEKNNVSLSNVKQPDLITGDMDSINPETLQLYECDKNCTVVHTDDQNETDFTKSLMELKNYLQIRHKQIDSVFALTESGGRFDQIIGNINTLHKAVHLMPDIDVFIISNESLNWLLWTGSHKIEVPQSVLQFSRWCSIIPFGSKSIASSTGLKWNLCNTVLAFGQMVSTSNTFTNSPVITITTDSPVHWAMGMNCNVID